MTLEADLAAASDPSTSAKDLLRLSKSRSPRVRRAVAENLAAPKEALARLFKEFPAEVLANPATELFEMEEDTWQPLSWIDHRVRREVAKTTSSLVVLERLALDEDNDVRSGASENALVTREMLIRFSSDRWWGARFHVARHKDTPREILEKMVDDPHSSVAYWAKDSLAKRP